MSDSPPPSYDQRTPSFRRLNWRVPSLGVEAGQLRPDNSYVERVLGAADDIRLCKMIFNSWATHLDRVSSEKPDERVRDVRQRLNWLSESVNLCSVAATEIVRCHAHFAYMMARRINGATEFDGLMEELAKDMASASSSLSQKIGDMMSDLAELVSSLEKIEVERKQSTMQWIFGWLEGFFNGLAEVFSCGLFIVPLVPPRVGLGIIQIAPSLSKLCRGAAELCKKASENLEEKEPKTVESVLLFLKKTVPEEAREAREILAQFDKAFVVRGLEEYTERVRTTTLPRSDLAIIAQEWSNVAGRYESMLPNC